MELNDYQKLAMTTCLDSSKNFSYMLLNLVGEVGEFSSKIAKGIRKTQMSIGRNGFRSGQNDLHCEFRSWEDSAEIYNGLKGELGDILWQLSGLGGVLGWSLEDIAEQNLDKLASRKERNVIDGSGDNR